MLLYCTPAADCWSEGRPTTAKTLEDGSLKIGIFNITSLHSGDIMKDISHGLFKALNSTVRNPNQKVTQKEYSNISQYFSFTISTYEALLRANIFSPKVNIKDY